MLAAIALSLALAPCTVPGVEGALRCGKLEVPENRARPAGRRISLNIVVLPAIGRRARAPLFDLEGGPGLAATDSAVFFAGEGAAYRKGRDIVLVDQRGTGASNALHCPALSKVDPALPMYPEDLVRECRAELSARADLSQYGTAQAVEDLEVVRRALGAPKIELMALSYGTVVAIAYARTYPLRVRAMALMGTVGDGRKLPLWHARNAQEALDRLVAGCLDQAACRKDYPGLMTSARQAREAIEGSPRAEQLRNLLGTNEAQLSVPSAIAAITGADPAAARTALGGSGALPFALGLYLSVTCPEETLQIRPEEIAPATAGSFLGEYRVRAQLEACRVWGLPASKPARAPTRPLAIPVLFMAGALDHVTPPAWAREAARGFVPSRVIEMPGMAHAPEGYAGAKCLDAIMGAFLDSPAPARLDVSCVAGIPAARYR